MKRKSSKAKPKKALLSQRERVEELLAKLVKDEDDRDEGPAGKGGKGKGSIKRERNDDGTSGTFKPMEKDEGEGQESVMLEGLAQDEDDRKLLGLDDEGADYEQEFDDDDVDATDENNAMIHHEVETEGEEEEDEEDEEEEEEEGVGQKEAEAVEAEAPPQAGGKRPLEEAAGEGAARPQKMGRTSMFAPGSVEGQMRDLMLAKVKISSKDLSRHLVQVPYSSSDDRPPCPPPLPVMVCENVGG